MRAIRHLASIAAVLGLTLPAAAADGPAAVPATHEEVTRALEELAGQLHGLGSRWREHFIPAGQAEDRPAITIALSRRAELGLSAPQVEALERLRADFQREAIRRDADLRVAEMDLATLRRSDPVDLARVEAKIREIERLRADLRLARIRAIEQGKAQLTAEQREKLKAMLAEPAAPMTMRPRAGAPPPPPRERF